MKLIRLGAAALNQTPLDWDGNRARIIDAISQAKAEQVSLLCLPELAVSGYGCEDAFFSHGVHEMSWAMLDDIAPHTADMIVTVGLPVSHKNALYNCVAVLANGALVGLVAKQSLPGDGIHYEPRWFKAWPVGVRSVREYAGRSVPIGDLFFEAGDIRFGFEICEDAWVADRPGAGLARQGIDLILNPSASHFAFGKLEVRKRLVLEGSRAFGVSYVYSNLLGNEAGRIIYDGGALIASGGRMVAVGPRFSFRDVELTAAVIDVDATRLQQLKNVNLDPALSSEPDHHISIDFEWPTRIPERATTRPDSWEDGAFVKEEELTRAVSLGLFDYMRKSRSRGFVISASGGADSSACACLAALSIELAIAQLGIEAVVEKLGHIPSLSQLHSREKLVRRLVTCLYQSTENSSSTTLRAARGVSEALGAEFGVLDVDAIAKSYVDKVSKLIGRTLDWTNDDIALQNIQARVRSPGVWLIANLKSALLLATSNRSEAAVGYTTMDGDTAGGLSPIGGIDKAFLRSWLRWMEKDGPQGFGPLPALSLVNVQEPTAELRPSAEGQTDEGDLMPYPLLDFIERLAIRDKQTPVEVFETTSAEFPQYGREQLLEWVERFFTLWARNQWKRERYAPSFHLDDENLDPKTWCRFPILSGSYGVELRALRQRHGPSEE